MRLASRRSANLERLSRGVPLGLLLAAATAAAGPAPALSACDTARAQSLEQLQAHCADVRAWIEHTGFDRTLSAHSRDLLSYADLAALWQRYEHPIGAAPGTASLPAIAAQVNARPTAEDAGWWQRVKAWVRAWFQRHTPNPDSALNRWLERLTHSTSFLAVLGYAGLGLVVLMAGGLIVNEFYRAGLLRRRRRPASTGSGDTSVGTAWVAGPAGLGGLMQRIVDRLEDSQRLAGARSLTHRELVSRARLDTDAQREVLGDIAARAERARYGGQAPGPAEETDSLRRGEALLLELGTAERP